MVGLGLGGTWVNSGRQGARVSDRWSQGARVSGMWQQGARVSIEGNQGVRVRAMWKQGVRVSTGGHQDVRVKTKVRRHQYARIRARWPQRG